MARHIVSCHVSKQARRPRSNASTSVATGGRRSLAGAVSQEKFLQGNRQSPKPTCTTHQPSSLNTLLAGREPAPCALPPTTRKSSERIIVEKILVGRAPT